MRRLSAYWLALALIVFTVGTAPAGADDRIKVFIDQDTSGPAGTDSVSIALLLQAPNVDVVGIGVVAGDAWLEQAVYHTLKIVELTGQTDVPVAAGSAVPLLNTEDMMRRREELWGEKAGDGWHGNWGDEVDPPDVIATAPGGDPTLKTVDMTAAELLIKMARKYPRRARAAHSRSLDQHSAGYSPGAGHRRQDQGGLHDGWPYPRQPALQLLVGR